MNYEVAMTLEVSDTASAHLLQHYAAGGYQEDLCFALWRPSTGSFRKTALVYEILLPGDDDRLLHGNASFQPGYFARAIRTAINEQVGLAFMHSHPGTGWQGMSQIDVEAERDILAYPAVATGLPLLGLTIGSDGYWSARLWEKSEGEMLRTPCAKVRVIGADSYRLHFDDKLVPPPDRKEVLRRTYDTWGSQVQGDISRLKVGIIGLGSVGSIVAEVMARIGIANITLIDPDRVEEHNLDRLLHATQSDIGRPKVELAEKEIRSRSTSEDVQIVSLPLSIHDRLAYEGAIDCDILFSCVDRPMGRDVLNYIAYAHLIPVIDGGVEVQTLNDYLHSAHWRAHLVVPHRQCMRCNGQYNTSMVVSELDGSLDDPSYIATLPPSDRGGNQNVFPFGLSLAGMEVNIMLHYLLALEWWPKVRQQDYQFTLGTILPLDGECRVGCEMARRLAVGDLAEPPYLKETASPRKTSDADVKSPASWRDFLSRLLRKLGWARG